MSDEQNNNDSDGVIAIKVDDEDESSNRSSEGILLKQTLMSHNECFLYQVPPLLSSDGYRANDWNLASPILQQDGGGCGFQVERRNNDLYLLFTLENHTKLFAVSKIEGNKANTINSSSIETVLDSSRYFVTKIQQGGSSNTNRTINLGFGFRDRDIAIDLLSNVQQFQKSIEREINASQQMTQIKSIPKLKKDETMHINFNNSNSSNHNKKKKEAKKKATTGSSGNNNNSGLFLLKKPPPSSSSISSSSANNNNNDDDDGTTGGDGVINDDDDDDDDDDDFGDFQQGEEDEINNNATTTSTTSHNNSNDNLKEHSEGAAVGGDGLDLDDDLEDDSEDDLDNLFDDLNFDDDDVDLDDNNDDNNKNNDNVDRPEPAPSATDNKNKNDNDNDDDGFGNFQAA